MNEIDPRALFRLSVLGPLVSRERLERGELQQIIRCPVRVHFAQTHVAQPAIFRIALPAAPASSVSAINQVNRTSILLAALPEI